MSVEMHNNKQQSALIMLDEHLAKDVSSAVCRAMQETFGIEITALPPETGEGMVSLVGDISGVIAMVQLQLEGTLILCMSFDMVHEILPQVLGKEFAITNEMTQDAVGEITNMIFGQVKRDLNARGYQIKLGIPCVVAGKAHFVSQFHRGKYLIVPFALGAHHFQVYVALHPNRYSVD